MFARVCVFEGMCACRPPRLSACERKPAHASLISWAMYRLHKKKKTLLRLSAAAAAAGLFSLFLDTLMLRAAVSARAKTEKLRNNKAEVLSAHAVIK